ncbi:MAG: hypothetical protein RR246_04605, partial [Clostridia bacterium]
MFKSVFTKYIVSFALLIALSFMLLVLTVSSMLTNYSIQSKKSLMAKTADGIAIVIDAYAAQSKNSVFEETIKTFSPHICADLVGFSGLSDTIIY